MPLHRRDGLPMRTAIITLVHDLDDCRLLIATPGRDAVTLEAAAQDLREHGGSPEAIQTVCMDMSHAYLAGIGKAISQHDV